MDTMVGGRERKGSSSDGVGNVLSLELGDTIFNIPVALAEVCVPDPDVLMVVLVIMRAMWLAGVEKPNGRRRI